MIAKTAPEDVEVVSVKPEPVADERESTQEPAPAPRGDKDEKGRDPRLALTLQEAEVIAQNLKESGTRR